MVVRDLRGRGISDERVLQAFSCVPRHEFIPDAAEKDCYGDHPVPIGHGQTVSQPYIVALMVELARIRQEDRVLEIGTGCGYQTAILARLATAVHTVEIVPELLARARGTLAALGCSTIQFREGDGKQGWPEHAPFDAILVSAAPAVVPHALESQLKEGGRLVIPVGPELGKQRLMRFIRRDSLLESEEITGVRFVPLV